MSPSHRGKVLVVDDDPDWREAITDFLVEEGYSVEQASNGREALEKLSQIEPLAIVTDIEMPLLDGRELLATAQARNRRVPVIVVSAERPMADDPTLVGAFCVMRKPVPVEDLLSAIARAGDHRVIHLPLRRLWSAARTTSRVPRGPFFFLRARVRARLGNRGASRAVFPAKVALVAIALVSSFALLASWRGRWT